VARDEKGIYAKALSGEATTVPGLQEAYEPPEEPEVVVDSSRESPGECARKIVGRLEELNFFTRKSS
jgi:adenylylsulfate kinase-like enzyme